MSHRLLGDASFHRTLFVIDADLAARARAGGCGVCGGELHVADYPRKPRGSPPGLGSGSERRHSFCCSREDCRKRLTPTSVRFLGRRVYTSVVVVLASALMQGLSGRRARRLSEELGVDRRTLRRWCRWWRESVPRTDLWSEFRGRLAHPLEEGSLPRSLLERIEGSEESDRLRSLLRLIAPLSHSARMRARFARVA